MIHPVNSKYFKQTVQKIKKDTPNEIQACCPLCGDTKYRLHLVHVKDGDYDYVKCFNAGCSVEEPTSLLNYLFLSSGDVYGYKRETLQNKIETIKNSGIDDIVKRVEQKQKILNKEIPNDIINTFKKCKDVPACLEYVKRRGIEPLEDWLFSDVEFFSYNNKTVYLKDYLIIPIFENGKYRGFYSRNIYKKEFSTFLLPDTEKIWVKNPDKLPDIITEGIFDALSIGDNVNVAAMIGASVSHKYKQKLPSSVIFVFDNDKTGTEKAIEYCKDFNVFVWPNLPFKDLNEMLVNGYKKTEIYNIIKQNTHKGIKAETLLRMKDI